MKVKKLVNHLKYNTSIRFYKENAKKPFAHCDSLYLLKNYPMDHDSYFLMNCKIKSIEPSHLKESNLDFLNIIVKENE